MAQRYMKRIRTLIVMLGAASAAVGLHAQAGDQGILALTVQDSGGRVVPQAALVLKDNATNDTRQAVTLAGGTYSFAALNTGTYSLTVSKPGFKDAVYDSIVIHAARVTDLSVTLAVGAVSEKVVVSTAQTTLLETTSNVIGTTIDLNQIEYLPMDDRDPTVFAYFLPGAANGYWNNQQQRRSHEAI